MREDNLTQVNPRQRAWLEVNLSALESNTRSLIKSLERGSSLMAVVKADGYGHGALTVSRAAIKGGATSLGVATSQEGIELRESGLNVPILVLGSIIDPNELEACLKWNLMPTLSGFKEAFLCQKLALKSGVNFKVHLKVDTGMSRLGCELNQALNLVEFIRKQSSIELVGIYSHLASADGDFKGESAAITKLQKTRFDNILKQLPQLSTCFCRHIANSAGTLRDKSLHYDMVRVGLAIYGYNPIEDAAKNLDLKPALSVKTRVTLIRNVPSGVGVSYGHKFITSRPTKLAVLGIGYADGVSRALSGKISVLANGKFIPQIGSITMDQLILDATDSPDLEVGNVVTLLGVDGDASITPHEWANLSGSIPWEVLCGFRHRLPRLIV